MTSVIVNIARTIYGKAGRSQQQILADLSTPNDFMPEWDKDPDEVDDKLTGKKQTAEQQKQVWMEIAANQNRKVKKEKEREAKLKKGPPTKIGDKKK